MDEVHKYKSYSLSATKPLKFPSTTRDLVDMQVSLVAISGSLEGPGPDAWYWPQEHFAYTAKQHGLERYKSEVYGWKKSTENEHAIFSRLNWSDAAKNKRGPVLMWENHQPIRDEDLEQVMIHRDHHTKDQHGNPIADNGPARHPERPLPHGHPGRNLDRRLLRRRSGANICDRGATEESRAPRGTSGESERPEAHHGVSHNRADERSCARQ